MMENDTGFPMQGDRETFFPPVLPEVAGGDSSDREAQTGNSRCRGVAAGSDHIAVESSGKTAWGPEGTAQHSHQRSMADLLCVA